MSQSPHQKYEFRVQVRHQERDEDPSVARFFRDIFWMTINAGVNVLFIPSFPHEEENWSLNIADDVEDVASLNEARQFTAALSDYTITPRVHRAGQQEVYPKPPPLPPSRGVEPRTGVMFYVTPQEFIRFSQELAMIEEHAFMLYEYLPFEEVKGFECIQFVTDTIVRSPHFAQKHLKAINLPWYARVLRPHNAKMNKIERLEPREDDDDEVVASLEEALAVQSV